VSRLIAACSSAALAAMGCAPVFSELQSARLTGRGAVELTPTATTTHFSGERESLKVQDELGLQLAAGVHDRVDLRVAYVRVDVDDALAEDTAIPGVNVLSFGPKVGLVKDRLALSVPVAFAFGEDIDSGESWVVQPTLIGTVPIARNLDAIAAGKVLYPFTAEDPETLVGLNLGLGLGPPDRWVFRPEIGFLWDPGEGGHYWNLSAGFTYRFGPKRSP
jgi:hypothetical protein